eukprot:153175-Prymnesium_polylepis.1
MPHALTFSCRRGRAGPWCVRTKVATPTPPLLRRPACTWHHHRRVSVSPSESRADRRSQLVVRPVGHRVARGLPVTHHLAATKFVEIGVVRPVLGRVGVAGWPVDVRRVEHTHHRLVAVFWRRQVGKGGNKQLPFFLHT